MLYSFLTTMLLLLSTSLNASDVFEKFSPAPVLIATSKAKQKPELNLFYSPSCPYSREVLDYLNQIHKKIPLTNVQNNAEAKDYLKTYGKSMKVPCLFIDGQPLYGADAIIEWLSQHKDILDSVQ